MSDPLLVVELAPLFFSGAATVLAAALLWWRGPRTGLTNSLTLLLILLGHLALVAAMVALPNDPGFAPRLLPIFQLAVAGAAAAFLLFLFEPHLDERRLDALLSSIIVSVVAFSALSLWRPELYWGIADAPGPLYATTGVRTALFAVIAWLLAAHALSRRTRFGHVPRHAAYVLSAGFALVAVHDATTASFRSVLDGAVDPSAAYLGAPFLAGLFLHLAWVSRRGHSAPARRQAAQFLLVGLLPALFSVLVIDLVVFRLVPGDRAGVFLDLVLRHLWMTALAVGTIWTLRSTSGTRAARRSASAGRKRMPQAEVQRVIASPQHDPRA